MLIRFLVTNFLSFKEETDFNMLTGNFKTHKNHVYKFGSIELLKGTAIYGSNGAGKSNLVKAVKYLHRLVEKGSISVENPSNPFKLDPKTSQLPSKFEIEFTFKEKIYIFGVSVTNEIIEKEWLHLKGKQKGKEDELVFERVSKKGDSSCKIDINLKYIKTDEDRYWVKHYESELLKPNELFLTKVKSSKKIPAIHSVNYWFEQNLKIIFPGAKFAWIIKHLTERDEFRTFTNEIFSSFHTGVEEITTKKVSFDSFFSGLEGTLSLKEKIITACNTARSKGESYVSIPAPFSGGELAFTLDDTSPSKLFVQSLITKHKTSDNKLIDFDFEDESDGTIRLLDYIPALELILNRDVTILIDEMDRSIHPFLLKEFVRKIMDETNTKGQLIFTTHESNLLDFEIFRQDEIWFAEKDLSGSTHLYPLSDFNPRYDLDIRRGYLNGRFGAIPFLGNLKDLKWNIKHEEE
jgi:hypothetical protein